MFLSSILKVFHAAYSLNSINRQDIGIQAITGLSPISHVADSYKVSRKFVYQQKDKALEGIKKAFHEPVLNEMGTFGHFVNNVVFVQE